jgi:uncharacterized protein YggE
MPPFRSALLAAALAAAPLGATAQPAEAPALPRTITVTGEGHASAAPDIAILALGVARQAPTAVEAMAAMGADATAILSRLEAEGIAAADVRTGQLFLEPTYDFNNLDPSGAPRMIGFIATQLLDVTLRDIGRVGGVLDAVVQDGANRIHGITFDLADPGAALDEARLAAVADARARAELYATAAGVRLGEIVAISDMLTMGAPFPYHEARGAAAGAAVPIAPGALTLSATVTLTFAMD